MHERYKTADRRAIAYGIANMNVSSFAKNIGVFSSLVFFGDFLSSSFYSRPYLDLLKKLLSETAEENGREKKLRH